METETIAHLPLHVSFVPILQVCTCFTGKTETREMLWVEHRQQFIESHVVVFIERVFRFKALWKHLDE